MSDRLEMARQSYAVAYVTAFCATTVLYDYFLTLGDEIRRMWPARISIPKTLFLLDRYVVLPMLVFNGIASTRNHLSPGFCVFYLRWLVVVITMTQAVVEGILLQRVIALYRNNWPVIALASFLYIGGTITLIGLTIHDYVGEEVLIVQDFSALPGCYAASVPKIIAGYWITPTIIESTFFGLVMWRVIVWSRDNMGVPPALVLMARDSTVYFAVVFALLFVNLFVFEYAPPFLSSLFVTPVNTAGCIAGYRMLMNLRSLVDTDAGMTDTEIEMAHLSGVRFVSRHFIRGRRKAPNSTTTMTTSTEDSDWIRTSRFAEVSQISRDTQTKHEVTSFSSPADNRTTTPIV